MVTKTDHSVEIRPKSPDVNLVIQYDVKVARYNLETEHDVSVVRYNKTPPDHIASENASFQFHHTQENDYDQNGNKVR